MANPRKFSDKLEIIRRKEEEANAAFVQIMREVSDARKGSPVHASHIPSHQQNTWIARNQNDYMKMRQIYKGGSLPNVNLSPNPPVNPQQQRNVSFGDIHFIKDTEGSYPSLNDGFNQPQSAYGVGGGVAGGGGGHVRRSMDPPSGPIFPSRNKYRSYTVTSPYRNNLLQQPSLLEEQTEAAPSLWRRTCSDSAIQQTLQLPPKSNTNGSGSTLLPSSGARIIQSQQSGPTEAQTYARSPPVSLQYVDSPSTKNHLNIQADTSSLPDLSNLSIPSPIQNPIDAEQEGKLNNKQREQQNHFQAPYRIPPRRAVVKQMYPRQLNSSTSDIIDTLQREQKPNINSFPEISVCSSNVTGSNPVITHSVSAPLSPVTPPYFWNTTPISPLATGDIMQSSSAPATDLQQQLFQIQNDNLRNNGIGNQNPPPYNFPSDDESYHSFCSNNYLNDKQNVYRNNSGPAHLSSTNSKTFCDHQLESALMRVKAQQGGGNDINVSDLDSALLRAKTLQGNELSQAQLNSVRVALDPLDFEDVQMLSDNAQLVDQSAEEQFRLERASYQ